MDADPRHAPLTRVTPWSVRRDGMVLRLDEHSLSLALFLLSVVRRASSGGEGGGR